MPTRKTDIMRMTVNAGMTQEHRETVPDGELLISDGFVPPRKLNVYMKKFKGPDDDLEKEFPWGAYLTVWWFLQGDELKTGGRCYFDAFHASGYDPRTKKQMRVNTALEKAGEFIRDWNIVRLGKKLDA